MSNSSIVRPRLLVVEDNYLMAEVVCDFLRECGMEPVGPACDLDAGLALAWEQDVAGAVLDINLCGRPVFPICSVLAHRGLPFIFLSAYAPGMAVPGAYRSVPYVEKPFTDERLRKALEKLLSGQGQTPIDESGELPRSASCLC